MENVSDRGTLNQEGLKPVAIKEPELAASAEWVRELEQRLANMEAWAKAVKEKFEGESRFITADDLEKRLSESHPSTSKTAVAARLCPNCGSPAHKSC